MVKSGVKPDPPKSVDFSSASIAKEVRKRILWNGTSSVAIPLAILGGLAFAVLEPSLLLLILAGGGIAAGSGSWLANWLRKDTFASEHIRKLREQMTAERDAKRQRLTKELTAYSEAAMAGADYAKQGVQQFAIAQKGFDVLQEILAEKLSPQELFFGRFLGTAEQLHLAILDNIREIASLLKSVGVIDADYIEDRLKKLSRLEKEGKFTKADEEEREALGASLGIREEQFEKINVLLTRNEEALTALDRTRAEVAQMRTSASGEATMDLETARAELERLARRVGGARTESFIKPEEEKQAL